MLPLYLRSGQLSLLRNSKVGKEQVAVSQDAQWTVETVDDWNQNVKR